MRPWLRVLGIGTLLASACVGPGGAAGRRTTPITTTGRPFSVRQSGDRITGQVCGLDIDYGVQRLGDRLRLSGFLDGRVPSQLEVRDEGGERVISGALGTRAGSAAVELHLRPDRLSGRVGFRRFDLVRRGDLLSGSLRMAGTHEPTTATLYGAPALQALRPEAQGAILPGLLTCYVARIGNFGRSALVVGFGGPAGADPRGLQQPL